jgi:glycosyltransferase involved in cell wall biosynthesis
MIPRVSLIIATYNRYELTKRALESIFAQDFPGLEVLVTDDGSSDDTPKLAKDFPIRYFRLERPGWTNPARAQNVGIRHATSTTLIMQSSEVIHAQPDTIKTLVEAVEADPWSWIFGKVHNYVDGVPSEAVYTGTANPRPLMFLSALARAPIVYIRGFDEDFTAYGDEDTDLADRLIKGCGLIPVFRDDIVGYHQDHERNTDDFGLSRQLYKQKTDQWQKGIIGRVRNVDREWGALDA